MHKTKSRNSSIILALAAAILFGASAPLNKLLIVKIQPISFAGFLYLGSGLIMLVIKGFQFFGLILKEDQEGLKGKEYLFLLGAILAGGVAAPIILLFSLKSTPAATSSLLLNFEVVATSLIAVVFFHEVINRHLLIAILLITSASILLSFEGGVQWGFSFSALGILGACFLWGIDNNFTKKVSSKDAISIVCIKGLAAGSFSLVLSQIIKEQLPDLRIALIAMAVGAVCYGFSIMFYVFAMRGLGASRTSALFGTSPIAGVLISLIIFKDPINAKLFIAFILVLLGILFLSLEKHSHLHIHERLVHSHFHSHNDIHHEHQHSNNENIFLLHTHDHTHKELTHEHDHNHLLYHKHVN